MFSDRPITSSASNAPLMLKGSASNTVSGCRKLLNCDASTMYATTTPSPSAKSRLSLASLNVRELPLKIMEYCSGSFSDVIFSMAAKPSACEWPFAVFGFALIVTARCRFCRVICCIDGCIDTVATSDKRTSLPSVARTNRLPMSSGRLRESFSSRARTS